MKRIAQYQIVKNILRILFIEQFRWTFFFQQFQKQGFTFMRYFTFSQDKKNVSIIFNYKPPE